MGPDRGFSPCFLAQGSPGPIRQPPGAPRRNRNSLARLRRAAASSDWSLPFCERGDSPLSHFPPEHAGSERSSLPFVFFARSAVRHHGHGAPVSDRHRACNQAWSAKPAPTTGPRSRGSAKPAAMTVRRTDLSDAPPARSGLRRSPRCAGRCRPEVGVPLPARRLCSIRTVPLAPLRGAVPTGGRRSLAGASQSGSSGPRTGP